MYEEMHDDKKIIFLKLIFFFCNQVRVVVTVQEHMTFALCSPEMRKRGGGQSEAFPVCNSLMQKWRSLRNSSCWRDCTAFSAASPASLAATVIWSAGVSSSAEACRMASTSASTRAASTEASKRASPISMFIFLKVFAVGVKARSASSVSTWWWMMYSNSCSQPLCPSWWQRWFLNTTRMMLAQELRFKPSSRCASTTLGSRIISAWLNRRQTPSAWCIWRGPKHVKSGIGSFSISSIPASAQIPMSARKVGSSPKKVFPPKMMRVFALGPQTSSLIVEILASLPTSMIIGSRSTRTILRSMVRRGVAVSIASIKYRNCSFRIVGY